MRKQFFPPWAVLALAFCTFAVWSQSASALSLWHKRIDPALLAKAKAGDAEAQYQLGNAFNYGEKVKRDYAQALIWYRKSAEQGNPDSEFQLGGLYHFGHGVPKDDVQLSSGLRKLPNKRMRLPRTSFPCATCKVGVFQRTKGMRSSGFRGQQTTDIPMRNTSSVWHLSTASTVFLKTTL